MDPSLVLEGRKMQANRQLLAPATLLGTEDGVEIDQ